MDKKHNSMYNFGLMGAKSNFAYYFTVNERARDWQIYCTDCGRAETRSGVPYPPFPQEHPPEYLRKLTSGRILNEFQLIYLTRGSGVFRSELTARVSVGSGDIVILFPGIWHAYRPDPEVGWQEYWVGFAGDYPQYLKEMAFISPSHPVIHLGYSESIIAAYFRLFEIAKQEQPGFQIELGGIVVEMLATIVASEERKDRTQQGQNLVEWTKGYIEEQLHDDIDLESLASRLGLSYSKLVEYFKKYEGLTPYQYFLQRRVNYAKWLLNERQCSVQEVAYELGFKDQFYFSRLFKKKTGVTPSEWQRGEFISQDKS